MTKKEMGDAFIGFMESQGFTFIDVTPVTPVEDLSWLRDLLYLSKQGSPIWCGALKQKDRIILFLIEKKYAAIKSGQSVGKLTELFDGVVITELGRKVLIQHRQKLKNQDYTF